MDFLWLLMLFCVLYACASVLASSRSHRSSSKATLPPGPRGIPIIGNMMQLGTRPHVSLATLTKTYGPVMRIKLGSVTTVVLSSPEAAKDVLCTHDDALSNRSVPDFVRAIGHDKHSMAFLPPTAQWRQLRKIAVTKMLASQRLDATKAHRASKVQKLLEFIRESSRKGEVVKLGEVAFTTTMNLVTTMLFSMDFVDYGSRKLGEFHEAITGLTEEAGKPNPVDFFPVIRYFNISSYFAKRGKIYEEKLMKIFEGLIKKRTEKRASRGHEEQRDDVLESLLDIVTEEKGYDFDEEYLKHLLLDLFVAGIDTTSSTTEWVMTELLRHPEVMAKARREIREVVGDNGWVQESDIPKLPYLQAIVKETLRLHPSVPFLLPRRAQADVDILGQYLVPKNTQIWINVWAMGRDPRVWNDAHAFAPERFLEHDLTEVGAKDFKFIPFGGGRRICPGLHLAQRIIHVVVGSLLYEFDWKLADGLQAGDVDMEDRFGITLRKAEPLRAIPTIMT